MVDFLRENGVTRLSRLTDGRVMCCICFEYRWPDELHQDAFGQRWDLCLGRCAVEGGASLSAMTLPG